MLAQDGRCLHWVRGYEGVRYSVRRDHVLPIRRGFTRLLRLGFTY
jgi:hypothetical protein